MGRDKEVWGRLGRGKKGWGRLGRAGERWGGMGKDGGKGQPGMGLWHPDPEACWLLF